MSLHPKDIDEPTISKDKKIHSIRVMSKRMRSLLYLMKPFIANKESFRSQKQFYKELSKTLSQNRETKVMYDTFQWIVKKCKLPLDDFEDIQNTLQQNIENKTIASSDIDKNLQICKQSILAGLGNLNTLETKTNLKKDLKIGFQKTYKKAYDDLDIALASNDAEDVHMFRKYAKYHMYQMELLTNHIKQTKKRTKDLDKLTSMLGKSHDLVLFEDYLHKNKNLTNSDALILCIAKGHKKLTKKALKSATKIFKQSPKKFRLFSNTKH